NRESSALSNSGPPGRFSPQRWTLKMRLSFISRYLASAWPVTDQKPRLSRPSVQRTGASARQRRQIECGSPDAKKDGLVRSISSWPISASSPRPSRVRGRLLGGRGPGQCRFSHPGMPKGGWYREAADGKIGRGRAGMAEGPIRTELLGHILVITIDRPEIRNAMDAASARA